MNGIQMNKNARRHDKPVPGCLGRMVNIFDLTTNTAGNKLLTDKPHRDGSPLSRSQSDVSRMSSPIGEDIEDKVMVSELRRSSSGNKSNGTPVKMLMAQEMSKDIESKQNSPNVVARLMGLDAIPKQSFPDLNSDRGHLESCSRDGHVDIPTMYCQQEECFCDKNIETDIHYQIPPEQKDIFEIWQQSQRARSNRDKSPGKGRSHESINEKKMMLIRQKFAELKRLATDEKLRQTKQYQEAIEVLSSNNDLLLKCLNESNSSFLQHFHSGQSIPPPAETKRITVLRPSKLVFNDKFPSNGSNIERQRKKSPRVSHATVWDNQQRGFPPTVSTWKADDSPQPTRIVVLKPNPGKIHGMKPMACSAPSSPRMVHDDNFFEEVVDDEAREAREVAKEITQHMRENLAGHRRDETLISSVFSNGYTGDESLFNKSEGEFHVGNLSDSEVMSPPSRHSWDYINKYGSPFSTSSLSRASYSPESSVCREAKKRLSERWAMMASNGTSQEQRFMLRSSNTLGEMLALSDIKKSEIIEEENHDMDQGSKGHTSSLNGNSCGEATDESPRSLQRSKSTPISSTMFNDSVIAEDSGLNACKAGGLKETVNPRPTKSSSFTGKVTSLFFLRNKKSSKEKSAKALAKDDEPSTCGSGLGSPLAPGRTSDDSSSCMYNNGSEEALSPKSPSKIVLLEFSETQRQGLPSKQEALSVTKTLTRGVFGENQDQPSPISVLEPTFEEDDGSTLLGCSNSIRSEQDGKQMNFCLGKSNLIDKSPPIGSIARTMSWDECCVETAMSYPLSSPFLSPSADEDEGEWNSLVQSLLSVADLTDEAQLSSNFARWHSPDSPLDPMLREKYIDLSTHEPLHEAKRRQLRSNRKLVFDCVNVALVDITGIGSTTSQWARPCGRRAHDRFVDRTLASLLSSSPSSSSSSILADRVWSRMKEWFPGERCDVGDSTSLVERVVMEEVVGKGWSDNMRIEIDIIGTEIEGKLLEELVESVIEWRTGRD